MGARGIESIQAPEDLQPAMGLAFFYSGDSTTLRVALDAVNVFDLWFIAIVSVGIKTACKLRLGPALLAVLGSWSLVQVLRLSPALVSEGLVG